jgi:hypothetical protein
MGDAREDSLPAGRESENKPSLRQVWFPRFAERTRYLRREDLSYGNSGMRNNLDIRLRDEVSIAAYAEALTGRDEAKDFNCHENTR